jgi:hypothetical protein
MNKQSFYKSIKYILISITFLLSSANCQASLIFINEIHYDNTGADEGEFVELAGTAGLNLFGWSLQFYNGSNGLVYKTTPLNDITLADSDNGFGFLSLAVSGIQNGGANGIGDGIALVDNNAQLIQFLSYEGAFQANDGAALGIFSENIPIIENGSPIGKSLQLTSSGNNFHDFEWVIENETPGSGNNGQHFTSVQEPQVIGVSEPNLQILFILFIITLFSRRRRAGLRLQSFS